jgi:hypothetical protein
MVLLSSMSAHHDGNDRVLADISVMRDVFDPLALSAFPFDFAVLVEVFNEVEVVNGSTCTISSHWWTIARIKLVFPTPAERVSIIAQTTKRVCITLPPCNADL